MKKNLNILIVILLFTAFFNGFAQKEAAENSEPLYWFGPYGALNLNFHSSSFDNLPGYPCCSPLFESGNGIGFSAGALFEYPLAKDWLLDIRLGYHTFDGKFTVEDKIGNTVSGFHPEERDEPVYVEYIVDSKMAGASLEPTVLYKIYKGLNASLGFRMAYLLSGSFDQEETITGPDFVTFQENGQKSRTKFTGEDIPDLSAFQFMLALGIGYDLEIGDHMYLTPEARFYLPFTNVSSSDSIDSWKVNTLQLGLALKIPVFPSKDKEVIEEVIYNRDTVVIANLDVEKNEVVLIDSDVNETEEELPDKIIRRIVHDENYEKRMKLESKLVASVDAVGIKADGSRQENPTVVIEEIEAEEAFPLLPHVFFEKGNADLSKSKMNLLDKSGAASFTDEKLPWNTMEIYADMLNIVGYRMNKYPKAKLTINGCNNNTGVEENNTALSQQRAEAVKNYLTDVWDINARRISVKSQGLPDNPGNNILKDGQDENKRAELSSNDDRIFKYISLKETIRTSNPPRVDIMPQIESDADISLWNLVISQHDEKIRDYSGRQVPGSIEWVVEEEPMPTVDAPIDITLDATDIHGQKVEASKQIQLKQLTIKKKRVELKDDKRIERFSLILFDFNKATITDEQIDVLNDIKKKITDESKVTILGYADRTGDKAYNRDLARRRSEEVQKILQVAPSKLKMVPVGNDVELYDNDLAEGRSYSRTVRVIIETPVK